MSPLSQKEVKQIGKGKDDKGKDDLCEEAKQILALLEKPMRHGEWLTQVKGIGLDKNKLNYESGKLQEKGLVDKNEEKLYYRTADGDAVVEAFKAKIAAGGPEEEEAPSNEAEEVQPPEQEIYKLEFTLRDNAPQKPIAVRFGDWRKGDFVHHRVSVNLQNFEDGEGEGQEGRPAGRIPVPCSVTHQGKSIVATCPKSGLKQSSYCETKARPGSALKRCLVLLDQQCQSCGEDYIHVDSNELETEDGLEQDV
jgi:hypothetical protein